ncbi:MAG: hypothetical protein ABSD47_12705 [Candidatus Methylomirabilota bacterium]|jgi:hypothetical protein
MRLNLTSSLEKALGQLEMEKQQVDGQIAAVRIALETLANTSETTRPPSTRAKEKRHRMTNAERKAVSRRMKAYWAKRRAVKTKGSERTKGD